VLCVTLTFRRPLLVVSRTVRRLFVLPLRVQFGIEFSQPLLVSGERVNRHGAVDEDR